MMLLSLFACGGGNEVPLVEPWWTADEPCPNGQQLEGTPPDQYTEPPRQPVGVVAPGIGATLDCGLLEADTRATRWWDNGQLESDRVVRAKQTVHLRQYDPWGRQLTDYDASKGPAHIWAYYDRIGPLNIEGYADDLGRPVGTWKHWSREGELVGEVEFVDGVPQSPRVLKSRTVLGAGSRVQIDPAADLVLPTTDGFRTLQNQLGCTVTIAKNGLWRGGRIAEMQDFVLPEGETRGLMVSALFERMYEVPRLPPGAPPCIPAILAHVDTPSRLLQQTLYTVWQAEHRHVQLAVDPGIPWEPTRAEVYGPEHVLSAIPARLPTREELGSPPPNRVVVNNDSCTLHVGSVEHDRPPGQLRGALAQYGQPGGVVFQLADDATVRALTTCLEGAQDLEMVPDVVLSPTGWPGD